MQFTVRVFRERLSIYECPSFPIGFKGKMWNLIVLVPEHFISFYFFLHSSLFIFFACKQRNSAKYTTIAFQVVLFNFELSRRL